MPLPLLRERDEPEKGATARGAQRKRAARGRPFLMAVGSASQLLTLSLSGFAMVILTTLSAGFLNCSPVAGLRTMRSGRSRQ